MRRKSTARRLMGPLALLFCFAVLGLVYYSAVGVGSQVKSKRREDLFIISERVLRGKEVTLANCTEFMKDHDAGRHTIPALQAVREDMVEVQRYIEDAVQKRSKMSRALAECRDNLKALMVKLHGAETSNAENTIDQLRKEEASLKETVEYLERSKPAMRNATREGIRALQAVLRWQAAQVMRGSPNAEGRGCMQLMAKERYSVVFDIGSTGNRVHVYRFVLPENLTDTHSQRDKQSGAPKYVRLDREDEEEDVDPGIGSDVWDMELKSELFEQNRIRMSEQETEEDVIAAVNDLMDKGIAAVPPAARRCTPVEFKATAGLRKKGPERAAVTLKQLRDYYASTSPLWVRGESPARILEGWEEGPLAWVTVNYLLGNFNSTSSGETAAIIDLGGGSTQIVFQPAADTIPVTVAKADLFISNSLGPRRTVAYQHSYEGLGLNEARLELLMQVQGMCAGPVHRQRKPAQGGRLTTAEEDDDEDSGNGAGATATPEYQGSPTHPPDTALMAHFPCFPLGYTDELGVANLEEAADDAAAPARSTPDFDKCVGLIRRYVLGLRKEAVCPVGECGMWGQPQPSMAKFTGPIYAFSYIHDFTKPHQSDSLTDKLTVADVGAIARRRCDALTLAEAARQKEAASGMGVKPEYECLHLSYIYALLRDGYGIPEERELTVVKKVNGFEAAWTLGAALMTLASIPKFMR